jgi:tRNA A37 N6-isopentenylltransferase MiaA
MPTELTPCKLLAIENCSAISKENSAYNLLSKKSKNTRRFAKRQILVQRDKTTKWYDFETPYQTIIDYIAHKIKIQFKIASLN